MKPLSNPIPELQTRKGERGQVIITNGDEIERWAYCNSPLFQACIHLAEAAKMSKEDAQTLMIWNFLKQNGDLNNSLLDCAMNGYPPASSSENPKG